MKLELVIRPPHLGIELRRPRQDVLVQRLHLAERNGMPRRIEVMQIAQQKAQRVAQLAIVLTHPLHQVFTRRNVLAEVDARHPQPNDLGAETLRDIHRINPIAQRL